MRRVSGGGSAKGCGSVADYSRAMQRYAGKSVPRLRRTIPPVGRMLEERHPQNSDPPVPSALKDKHILPGTLSRFAILYPRHRPVKSRNSRMTPPMDKVVGFRVVRDVRRLHEL